MRLLPHIMHQQVRALRSDALHKLLKERIPELGVGSSVIQAAKQRRQDFFPWRNIGTPQIAQGLTALEVQMYKKLVDVAQCFSPIRGMTALGQ